MTATRDASSNFPWPPAIYLSALAIGFLLRWLEPLRVVESGAWRAASLAFGAALFIAGGAVALAAEWRFFRARTATLPTRPTTSIVATGIFGYTRNPMYLGMSLALASLGLLANSWWFLIALPLAVIAVTKLAIEREERYLEEKFGAEYQAFKAKVRRWF